MTGLGTARDTAFRKLSAIFLCSEQVSVKEDAAGSRVQYSGTIFMRYHLSKSLMEHPNMMQEHSATEKSKSPFETRYNLERDAAYDVKNRFAVGFAFNITIPENSIRKSTASIKENYKYGKGLDSPTSWRRNENTW